MPAYLSQSPIAQCTVLSYAVRMLSSQTLRLIASVAVFAICGPDLANASNRGGSSAHIRSQHTSAVVGVWIVKDATAPFPFHMYGFNADGTMQQANPDAGDARTSDSDGKGVWCARGDRIIGKWVEISADRSSHKFAGRLDLSFDLKVNGNVLTGFRSAQPFDENGKPNGEPFKGDFSGTRVTLP